MAFRALFCISLVSFVISFFSGCFSTQVRLPSSVNQVYKNSEIQQVLGMAAQNNILFHIPEATTREHEKTEIDAKCREVDEPLWAEKLSVYLAEFRKHPEYLTKFHILEIKRGDTAQIQLQKDLDGAMTISVQFVKIESRGRVQITSRIPCKGSIAEYLGRELVKTDYEFPSVEQFGLALQKMPERVRVPRLQFQNGFLSYLAERGVIFKFSHEMSFEKTVKGQFVMAEALNQLSEEIKQPFHKYVNYWFKQISEKSTQAQVLQMFGLISDRDLKSGVKVESESDFSRRTGSENDLTYVFTSYSVENEQIKLVPLQELDKCLQGFTEDMSGVKLRKPASTDKESFLRPGYSCSLNPPPVPTAAN
ncbi:MAG: hypothetical protein H7061_05950 [Bdellovibrionaceae bacterium]|nr:hypothetical protein [Bdellovibrio sp.]